MILSRRQDSITIRALGTASAQKPGKALAVHLLGRDEALRFSQGAEGLQVFMPAGLRRLTADLGIGLKLKFV
jgi:hypothetical protein